MTELVRNVTGHDESYLAELLLEEGYEDHGRCRYDQISEATNKRGSINPPQPI